MDTFQVYLFIYLFYTLSILPIWLQIISLQGLIIYNELI